MQALGLCGASQGTGAGEQDQWVLLFPPLDLDWALGPALLAGDSRWQQEFQVL